VPSRRHAVALRVLVEQAAKRPFASALDWPGWSRGGKTPEAALEALVEYAPRYSAVARRAKLEFRPPSSVDELQIVERMKGGSGTEFGVPAAAAEVEEPEPRGRELERLVALLAAAWATFDSVARRAEGVELTKGPRGGGRDLDRIVGHVREAEVAYLAQLGSRAPASADENPKRPMALVRDAFITTLRARAAGDQLPNPRNARSARKPWSPRYAMRRSAWHALDHAWEIEDRSRRPS